MVGTLLSFFSSVTQVETLTLQLTLVSTWNEIYSMLPWQFFKIEKRWWTTAIKSTYGFDSIWMDVTLQQESFEIVWSSIIHSSTQLAPGVIMVLNLILSEVLKGLVLLLKLHMRSSVVYWPLSVRRIVFLVGAWLRLIRILIALKLLDLLRPLLSKSLVLLGLSELVLSVLCLLRLSRLMAIIRALTCAHDSKYNNSKNYNRSGDKNL